MDRIRDRFWVWGHPVGAHNSEYGILGTSRMTVMESCRYLGAENALMVNYRGMMKPPLDQEAMALDSLRNVIWSIVGAANTMQADNAGYLEEICRIARKYPNITGGVFDDFFCVEHEEERKASYTVETLKSISKIMHENPGAPLDMWAVLYEYQLDYEIAAELSEFDGILFWTWFGRNLKDFDKNFAKCVASTAGKRRMLGCYMYNYGENKTFGKEEMQYQLETYTKAVRDGKAEGIILLSNVIADLGLEAVEYTKSWLKQHGDEEI